MDGTEANTIDSEQANEAFKALGINAKAENGKVVPITEKGVSNNQGAEKSNDDNRGGNSRDAREGEATKSSGRGNQSEMSEEGAESEKRYKATRQSEHEDITDGDEGEQGQGRLDEEEGSEQDGENTKDYIKRAGKSSPNAERRIQELIHRNKEKEAQLNALAEKIEYLTKEVRQNKSEEAFPTKTFEDFRYVTDNYGNPVELTYDEQVMAYNNYCQKQAEYNMDKYEEYLDQERQALHQQELMQASSDAMDILNDFMLEKTHLNLSDKQEAQLEQLVQEAMIVENVNGQLQFIGYSIDPFKILDMIKSQDIPTIKAPNGSAIHSGIGTRRYNSGNTSKPAPGEAFSVDEMEDAMKKLGIKY